MIEARPETLLQVWFSPLFPTGAFAYSHGLEQAQESSWVIDAAQLQEWLKDLITAGSIRSDIALASIAHRAAESDDDALLKEAAELALALAPSAERSLETIQQGNAFAAAIRSAWPCEAITRLGALWPGDLALPVAAGVSAAGHAIARGKFLNAFATGTLCNLVSAAIRLGITGQTGGQRTIAALAGILAAQAEALHDASADDIWSGTFMSDLASLQHETQYTRLFRS